MGLRSIRLLGIPILTRCGLNIDSSSTDTRIRQLKHRTFKDPLVFFVTVFGLGWFPWAPGTVASIVAFLSWWFLISSCSVWVQMLAIGGLVIFTFTILGLLTSRYGDHDAPAIVIDEFLGMWAACFLLPQEWWLFLVTFIIFRFLDIFKPWPINWIDQSVKGSLGIALDDLVAGGIACGLSHTLWILLKLNT